jgi:MFS family permease
VIRFSPESKIFFGISSFEMLAMFRRGLFYAYLSIYLRHFLGLSVTETTLFATLPMLLNILFQTFCWGPLSDRLQKRRTLIVSGEILGAVGTLAVWAAHRLPATPEGAGYAVIIGLALVEIFWSMSNVGWSALISDVYREVDRSTVQGRLASLGGMGRIAGVWIGGLFYDGMGMRYNGWGFESGALFAVASAVMLLSVLPMLAVPEGGVGQADPRPAADAPSTPAAGGADRLFALFLAAMVLINFGRNAIVIMVSQFLTLESGLAVSSRVLADIFNTQSAAMIVTGLFTGTLVHRLGNGNTVLLGTAGAIASLLIMALSLDPAMMYLAHALRGFADVTILAAAYTLASTLMPPARRARRFAWFNATFFLSWGVGGTLIAGPLTDLLMGRGISEIHAYQAAFGVAALMTTAGLILLAVLRYAVLPRARRHAGTDSGQIG